MKIAVIQISEAGRHVAYFIQQELGAQLIERTAVGANWQNYDAFVFIGAMGICVRTIAPYIKDKHEDPAVVCVDSFGNHVISVLSGHIGGANDLTKQIAGALGVDAVITTQSDNAGLWALDTIYENYDWHMSYVGNLNTAIGKFVNREPVALLLDIRDEGTDYLERTCPQHVTIVNSVDEIMEGNYALAIIVSPFIYSNLPSDLLIVQYTPQVLDLGIGLAHQAPTDTYEDIQQLLDEHHICLCSECIRNICTIDIKAEEPVIQKFQEERYGLELKLYSADELAKVDVPTPSETVEKHVGTPSVCEAAALLASNHGKLLLPKVKGEHYTLAVAIDRKYLREGHIEIVGAGPGDPDLVSVRGRKMLERADLILYAGSLVPKALTECHKPGAVVRSSADMAVCIPAIPASSVPYRNRWRSSTRTTWTITLRPASRRSLPLPPSCRASLPFLSVARPLSSRVARAAHPCPRRNSCTYWLRVRALCVSSSQHRLSMMCSANS